MPVSQSTSLVVTLLWMRACSICSYVRLWAHSAWARGWVRGCVTRVPLRVPLRARACVQSYAFGDNVVLQASDLHAPASWANIGVVEGCLSGRPRSVVFNRTRGREGPHVQPRHALPRPSCVRVQWQAVHEP